MNERIREEIQAESSSICIAEMARIRWDDGEMRIINNNEAVTVDGEEYTPCGFSFTPPSSDDRDGEITVDDTDGNLAYIVQLKDRITVTIAVVDIEAPSYPLDGPVDFDVSTATASSSDGKCTLSLSSRSKLSYGLSKYTYSPQIFPGLFG